MKSGGIVFAQRELGRAEEYLAVLCEGMEVDGSGAVEVPMNIGDVGFGLGQKIVLSRHRG